MNMPKSILPGFILSFALLTACSPTYTYFTKSLYEQEKWTPEEIQRIQFYVSKDIVLNRTISGGESTITEGKIKIVNGERVEQVVVKAGTPGVLVMMPREDRFAISFEEADDEAFLMFGPNPKFDNRYALLAQEWERDGGQVHYRDKVYYADASNAYASLMVDLKRASQSQYETRQAKGRVITD